MSSKNPPKIEALRTELEELKNPTDRPPMGTPREAVQIVDRHRLLAAWESNVNTMRAMLNQMQLIQRSYVLTRVVLLSSVLLNLLLLSLVMHQLGRLQPASVVIERPHGP